MSLICLCITDVSDKSEVVFYRQRLEALANYHKCGILFSVDWPEPIVTHNNKDSFIINIVDCPASENCELFLLPDGWYYNGCTNSLTFKERMSFLQDIASILIEGRHHIDFYLGQSGTAPEEFVDITLQCQDLIEYLSQTIGIDGADNGVHISIIP